MMLIRLCLILHLSMHSAMFDVKGTPEPNRCQTDGQTDAQWGAGPDADHATMTHFRKARHDWHSR